MRLRWRFDYHDGTHRAGLWDEAGKRPKEKWSYQPSNGMLKASIEVVDKSGVPYLAVSVPAHDFKRFEYHAVAIVKNVMAFNGSQDLDRNIIGMSIYTNSGRKITINCDATHFNHEIKECIS